MSPKPADDWFWEDEDENKPRPVARLSMRSWLEGFWFTFVPLLLLAWTLEFMSIRACFGR